MAAVARVRPLTAEPSMNMRRHTGWAWRLGMAESKAATWITRIATSASSQTSQMLSSRYCLGFHSSQAQTRPLTNINKVGNNEP
jgi:hypothetical protein